MFPTGNPMPLRLNRTFYRRAVVSMARSLLGQRLVRVDRGRRLAGIIVETEAYLGIPDLAAHTSGGRRTPRNEPMWLDGGHLYVYFTYGMHHCANVVAQCRGEPVAALLRAIEPTEGLKLMYKRRHSALRDTDLCSGPAKLCAALGLDRRHSGVDLCRDKHLFIEQVRRRAFASDKIAVLPRIGVAYAKQWADKPLRFTLKDSPYVSRF